MLTPAARSGGSHSPKETNTNWWTTLVPIFLEILRKFLENRNPQIVMGAGGTVAPHGAFLSDAECDDMANKLEQAVAKAPKGAVGHEGGIVAHVTEFIAALRARDWTKISAFIKDFVNHL
jgi:hypothetical protein